MPEQADLKFAGFTGWIPVSPTKKICSLQRTRLRLKSGTMVSRYCRNSETESKMGSEWLTKTSIMAE